MVPRWCILFTLVILWPFLEHDNEVDLKSSTYIISCPHGFFWTLSWGQFVHYLSHFSLSTKICKTNDILTTLVCNLWLVLVANAFDHSHHLSMPNYEISVKKIIQYLLDIIMLSLWVLSCLHASIYLKAPLRLSMASELLALLLDLALFLHKRLIYVLYTVCILK